jgi:hypothetical protein
MLTKQKASSSSMNIIWCDAHRVLRPVALVTRKQDRRKKDDERAQRVRKIPLNQQTISRPFFHLFDKMSVIFFLPGIRKWTNIFVFLFSFFFFRLHTKRNRVIFTWLRQRRSTSFFKNLVHFCWRLCLAKNVQQI